MVAWFMDTDSCHRDIFTNKTFESREPHALEPRWSRVVWMHSFSWAIDVQMAFFDAHILFWQTFFLTNHSPECAMHSPPFLHHDRSRTMPKHHSSFRVAKHLRLDPRMSVSVFASQCSLLRIFKSGGICKWIQIWLHEGFPSWQPEEKHHTGVCNTFVADQADLVCYAMLFFGSGIQNPGIADH